MADRYLFPAITAEVRQHASFGRLTEFGPTLSDRVVGSVPLCHWQRFGRVLSRVLGRVEVHGLGRIPASGPVILATNHQSFMDGPLLFGFVNRVVSCLVKAEAFAPLSGRLGRILISGAQIPVLRGEVDAAPVRLALRLLDAGGVLGIFPEGTRGDGRADRSMAGAGYFALRTGAAVVPVAIHGSAHLMHRGGIARPRVRMTFGEPIGFEPSTPPLHRPDWIEAAEQIRTALADLVRTTEFLPEPKVAMISASAKAGT